MSLSCEDTVKMIRSFGSVLSLTVVTVQRPINNAASEMHACELLYSMIFLTAIFNFKSVQHR